MAKAPTGDRRCQVERCVRVGTVWAGEVWACNSHYQHHRVGKPFGVLPPPRRPFTRRPAPPNRGCHVPGCRLVGRKRAGETWACSTHVAQYHRGEPFYVGRRDRPRLSESTCDHEPCGNLGRGWIGPQWLCLAHFALSWPDRDTSVWHAAGGGTSWAMCPMKPAGRQCTEVAGPKGICPTHASLVARRRTASAVGAEQLVLGVTLCRATFGGEPCHRAAWARGLCGTHLGRERQGFDMDARLHGRFSGQPCPFEVVSGQCGGTSEGDGWCITHGRLVAAAGTRCRAVSESGDRCGFPTSPARGLCHTHAVRERRTGDVYKRRNCTICGGEYRVFGASNGFSTCGPACRAIRDQAARRRVADMRRDRAARTIRDRVTIERLIEAYGEQCHLCRGYLCIGAPRYSPYEATIDHLVPISKGGERDAMGNARPAHGRCNAMRNDMDLDVWHEACEWANACWLQEGERRPRRREAA